MGGGKGKGKHKSKRSAEEVLHAREVNRQREESSLPKSRQAQSIKGALSGIPRGYLSTDIGGHDSRAKGETTTATTALAG